MNTLAHKVAAFAALVEQHQNERAIEQHYGSDLTDDQRKERFGLKVKIKPGNKYTKVNIGTGGRYMVENATGHIFGIKGYGVIHRGHYYGTLDTIHDWFWGNYYPDNMKSALPTQGSSGIPKLTKAPVVAQVTHFNQPDGAGVSLHAPTGTPELPATIVALPDVQTLSRDFMTGGVKRKVVTVSDSEQLEWAKGKIADGIQEWWILAKKAGVSAVEFDQAIEGFTRKAVVGALTY